MKITYRGTVSRIDEEIGSETPTDLTGSTCDIVLTITGEKALTVPPTPQPVKPAKTPKPAKKPTPKKSTSK